MANISLDLSSTTSLATLNADLDYFLSHNDNEGLNDISRKFTVFITSFLDNIKTSSGKQGFNAVVGRFLCHLLHHYRHEGRPRKLPNDQYDDEQVVEEEDEADEDYDYDSNERTPLRVFFSSCLVHLFSLTIAARRLLAQVLRHCCLTLSSTWVLHALWELLENHPQKLSLEHLSEFLPLWLIGSEGLIDAQDVSQDAAKVVIETIAALLVQGPGASSASKDQRSFFSLLRVILRSTTSTVHLSSASSAKESSMREERDCPLWVVFWSELWALVEVAPGIDAQLLGIDMILSGGVCACAQLLQLYHSGHQLSKFRDTLCCESTEQRAQGEAARLAVCLQIASSESTVGTVQLYALQGTSKHILEAFDRCHSTCDVSLDTLGAQVSMMTVLTSGLVAILQIIQSLLHLLPSDSNNSGADVEEVLRVCQISTSERSVDTDICSEKSEQDRGEKSLHLLLRQHQIVSKKVQMECVSLLAAIVVANPFRRDFPADVSSPIAAMAMIAAEEADMDLSAAGGVGGEVGKFESFIVLRKLERSFLECLHPLLTMLSLKLLHEEDTRGIAGSTLSHLQAMLLSKTCGGACPRVLLQLLMEKESKLGSVDSTRGEGQRGEGCKSQTTLGCQLLRRVVEQRMCNAELVLELTRAAVMRWDVTRTSSSNKSDERARNESGENEKSELFVSPEFSFLASQILNSNQKQQQQSLIQAFFRQIDCIKTHPTQSKEISSVHLLSLLFAVSGFMEACGISSPPGSGTEHASTVDFVRGAARKALNKYLLSPQSLQSFHVNAIAIINRDQSQGIYEAEVHVDLEQANVRSQENIAEFVFWLHLLTCYLHNNEDERLTSGMSSLTGLVHMLYPSQVLLLPHVLPAAVRLACCLPPAAASSPMSLLCETVGYFQDIVFTNGGIHAGENIVITSAGVVQYIDLIALVIAENIASVKRSSRLEVMSKATKLTARINSTESTGDDGGDIVDYMEREHQEEEIAALVHDRLLLSIACSTAQGQSQQCGSFLGCFIPFIHQILLDGVQGISQRCDSVNNPNEEFRPCVFSIPPAPVLCAALRCWGQYLLCGLGSNSSEGTSSSSLQRSYVNILNTALLRLPLKIYYPLDRSFIHPKEQQAMLRASVNDANSVFEVKKQALDVYLQTLSVVSRGETYEQEDGAVLVAALLDMVDFVYDEKLGTNDPKSSMKDTSEPLLKDESRRISKRIQCSRPILSPGNSDANKIDSDCAELFRETCRNLKVGRRRGKRSNTTKCREKSGGRLKKKGKFVIDRDDNYSPNCSDEISFEEISVSQCSQESKLEKPVDSIEVSDIIINEGNVTTEAVERMRLNCAFEVQQSAVRGLHSLLTGLGSLVQQQRIKHLTAACIALATPLAFPLSHCSDRRSSSTQSLDSTWSQKVSRLQLSVQTTSVLSLKKVFTSFPWVAGRIIFRVSCIFSEGVDDDTCHQGEGDRGAQSPDRVGQHSCDQASVRRSVSMSIEQEACSRVRCMTFAQQERMLRHVLLTLSISQQEALGQGRGQGTRCPSSFPQVGQERHEQQGQHVLQLQKAVVEEVLRARHPALLASLLVPPSSDGFAGEVASPLYLCLTNPLVLKALHDAEATGHWQALSLATKTVLREAQCCAGLLKGLDKEKHRRGEDEL